MGKRHYKDMQLHEGVILQWVGPKVSGNYTAYIRFEDEAGGYVCSIDGRQMRALYKRLKTYYAPEYNKTPPTGGKKE